MSSLPALIAVAALAASGGQEAPDAGQPSTGPASLKFVAKDPMLGEAIYGIDAIDGLARAYGQRQAADVAAGLRTVWYSCPAAPVMDGGSRVTFEFVAGRKYELVCRSGQEAEIRAADNC